MVMAQVFNAIGTGLTRVFDPTREVYYGKVYLGFPDNVFSMPVAMQELVQHKRLARHEIPGRNGDIIDDMGSPARQVRMAGKISSDILAANVFESPVAVGATISANLALRGMTSLNPFVSNLVAFNPVNVVNFERFLNNVWKFGIVLPIISDLITSLVIIQDLNWIQDGGKPGIFRFSCTLVEKLPYSVT